MRELGIVEFVTLDGVMQGLAPGEDDGFEYGGWGAPYGDEVLAQQAGEGMPRTTAYLFGRKTYEHMAAHWPHQPDDDPIARYLNTTPKYVATRTLTDLDWEGAQVLQGDVVDAIRELKREGEGSITVLGSGDLVQTLIEHDLIDQYQVFIHPLVLGAGKTLFRSMPRPLRLRLVSCTQTTTGVLLAGYRRE